MDNYNYDPLPRVAVQINDPELGEFRADAPYVVLPTGVIYMGSPNISGLKPLLGPQDKDGRRIQNRRLFRLEDEEWIKDVLKMELTRTLQ